MPTFHQLNGRLAHPSAVFYSPAVQIVTLFYPPGLRYNGGMKHQYVIRLEAHLEQFIEGTFAGLFGKKIRAQDVALQLARVMESGLKSAPADAARPIAPDQYTIHIHPDVQSYLLNKHPDLARILAGHLLELATQAGYQLYRPPAVFLLAEPTLDTDQLTVTATHSESTPHSTIAMERVELPATEKPANPRLVINGERTIPLKDDVINIGRHPQNNIILDDAGVSRFHLQLRLRFGSYTLFDVQSQGGTLVNGVRVEECRLRSGDTIQIGQTAIVYMDDHPPRPDSERTESFTPVNL